MKNKKAMFPFAMATLALDLLLEWILSEEGQYIIEETGYVGIAN